jgi:hypothetical protein
LGDSIELDVMPLQAGERSFGEDDRKIAEIGENIGL